MKSNHWRSVVPPEVDALLAELNDAIATDQRFTRPVVQTALAMLLVEQAVAIAVDRCGRGQPAIDYVAGMFDGLEEMLKAITTLALRADRVGSGL